MKKYFILFTAIILIVPSFVYSDIASFKVGYFLPRAQSDLWETEFENMDFVKGDFQNTNFCFAYEYFLSRELSLVLSIDGYTKNKVGIYKDYVGYADPDGDWAYPDNYEGEFYPTHNFNISITPVQCSVKLTPMGRKGKIIPYVGGGLGLYLWNVRIQGDLIDFSDPWYDLDEEVEIYPIYPTDAREENKISIGYNVFGGIMVPVANRISLEAEFKYNKAQGNLTDAFEGFEPFDLSGYQITIGLNYWF